MPGSDMHVLLVEDDVVLADGISRILVGQGMVVDVVQNGLDADRVLQLRAVAVVVLDVRDQVRNGRGGQRGFDAAWLTIPVAVGGHGCCSSRAFFSCHCWAPSKMILSC